MTAYLHHVTLTTGHARASERSEVSGVALEACREILRQIVRDQVVPVPGTTLLLQPGPCTRKCAWMTVVTAEGERVAQIVIAGHSRCGSRAWRLLHEVGDPVILDTLATSADDCPPEPWLAARLEIGATLLSPATLMLLGDLERCLGWAWIDMMRGGETRGAQAAD